MSYSHERGRAPGVSYSWRSAIGLSGFLNGIARCTGVPTSRSGRQRKIGRLAIRALGVVVLGAIAFGYYAWTHSEEVKQIIAAIEAARAV